jgi:AAA15 family ATPase/GTPase
MLIELKIKNFRSFREEAVLSLVASADKSHLENTISLPEFGNRKLLRTAVIYGSNAAGKTNLISAVHFIDKFVNTSMDRKLNDSIDVKPFLLSSEPNTAPSEFEITFMDDNNIRFQYGFHLTSARIIREWLISYPKGLPQTWFERENNDDTNSESKWHFGRNLKGKNNQLAELTRNDILFLSNAAKLNHRQLGRTFKWFQECLRVIDANEISPILFAYSAKKAKDEENTQVGIRRLLEVADFGISGFDIREETYTEKDLPEEMPVELRDQILNKKHLDVYMRHPVTDEIEVPLPLEEESSGTQRFFALSGPLAEVLQNGWTLFVDELDSSLHPLLVRYLVELFHSQKYNPRGAQLIFNTHDTTLMDCCIFRRDQIWFMEKDRQSCSHLYPLLDFSPRKDEALAKGYLMGRYGAIPFLSKPNWGDTENDEA